MSLGPESFYSDDVVMIVEDEMFTRKLLGIALKNMGAPRLEVAESVTEAEGLLRTMSRPPRLMILDYLMPGRTGLDLLHTIRSGQLGIARDLPVVMLSGVEEEAVVAAAVALDVDAFVKKPLMAEGLRARLPFLLEQDRKIKEPEAYETVTLRPLSPPTSTEVPGNAINVSLDELQPFQRLAADIHSQRGGLIATKGVTVSGRLIALLHDLKQAGLPMTPIWVSGASG